MPARPGQIPLDLGHAPALSRDDLIVGASNAQAVALIDRWPDWPGHVAVLAGPAGSGKSHLAAIWSGEAGAIPLDPARLGASAIEAASAGPVLLDDLDAAPLDETGLFHLLNAVRAAGTGLLIASRRFPLAWGAQLPDLTSRLKTLAVVEIAEPDDFLLTAIVTKLFADRQIQVEPHVVRFLARRMERSLAVAIDMVERLDRTALQRKSRITRALAAEMLGAP